jgi:hypothetical protein
MQPAITKHYTQISSDAARRAVEMLDKKQHHFAAVFAVVPDGTPENRANLLN